VKKLKETDRETDKKCEKGKVSQTWEQKLDWKKEKYKERDKKKKPTFFCSLEFYTWSSGTGEMDLFFGSPFSSCEDRNGKASNIWLKIKRQTLFFQEHVSANTGLQI